jgi:hypothetical protein
MTHENEKTGSERLEEEQKKSTSTADSDANLGEASLLVAGFGTTMRKQRRYRCAVFPTYQSWPSSRKNAPFDTPLVNMALYVPL